MVPLAILVLALMVAFVGTSVETSRATVGNMDSFRAKSAAQNAAAMAISKVWGDYESTNPAGAQLWSLRAHLDSLGIRDQASAANAERTKFLSQMQFSGSGETFTVDGTEIERLDVYRVDEWDATTIVIEVDAVARRGVDGSSKEARSSVQEVFSIAPPAWEGLDYALLANNINCLLCHTTIDSAERFYNGSAALAGSFDAVRIGSIDSIHFRSDPDSKIAGVALIGGDAMEGDGDNIADWSRFNLQTARLNGGKIVEDSFLDVDWEKLALFDPARPDDPSSVYLDFFSHAGSTDYDLPESFPPPFPDNGGLDPVTGQPRTELAGNRIVDDSEFLTAVDGSNGTISGGAISVIPAGQKIASTAARQSMERGTDPSINGLTSGNVFLHGTKANPIVLDGSIAIDGDVILSGYVIGEGSIKARGNVYVPGDLVYADKGRGTGGTRQFGVAADGRTNSLAVAAGGNIIVGDFYRPAWGQGKSANGEKGTSFNFTMDELAIFNRQEWMKTQPTLPGKPEKVVDRVDTWFEDEKVKEYYWKEVDDKRWVKTGKKIKKQKYKWIWVSNGKKGEYEKKTKKKVKDGFKWVDEKVKKTVGKKKVKKWRWKKTGKKIEKSKTHYKWVSPPVPNPYYSRHHTPRYYSFAEGSTIPVFNKDGYLDTATNHWKSDEYPGDWDDKKLTYADVNDRTDPLLYDASGQPKAVVSSISPTGNWISPDMMEKLIEQTQRQQQGNSKTIEIDATLYSANSILGTVPITKSPNTNGELLVNGGIVAADVGILAPGGTRVNYDGRGARSLAISSDSGLTIRRRLTAPLPNL